jgi:hypothetical protein
VNYEEIVRMAKEVGGYVAELPLGSAWLFDDETMLERFAALVAAHERDKLEVQFNKMQALYEIREGQPNKPCCLAEREACAKVCEEGINNAEDWDSSYWDQCCENRAAAIRARGEK